MAKNNADRYIAFTLASAMRSRAKSINIYLFGGEPLLNMDVGLYILEEIKSFCEVNSLLFNISIVTNGTLLDKDMIEKLQNFNCTVQITLDGVREVHNKRRMYSNGEGSFEVVLNALRELNKNVNIKTIIRVNIDRTNINSTYDLLDFIGKNGEMLTNCTVNFGIVRTQGAACSGYSSKCISDNEIGNVLYELWTYAEKQGFQHGIKPQRKFLYCGMYCENAFIIAPNLDVYKCVDHTGVSEHLMGRIDEMGNYVDQTSAFYEWMTVDPLKNDTCKKCVYLPTCGGGCGVISYNESGSYQAEGCFCTKGTVEKTIIKFVEDKMKNRTSI